MGCSSRFDNFRKVVKSGSDFRFDNFQKVVKSAVVRDLTTFEKLSNLVLILDLTTFEKLSNLRWCGSRFDNFRKVVKSNEKLSPRSMVVGNDKTVAHPTRSHAPAWECREQRANVAGKGRWRVGTTRR